jgi:hypothetical protein
MPIKGVRSIGRGIWGFFRFPEPKVAKVAKLPIRPSWQSCYRQDCINIGHLRLDNKHIDPWHRLSGRYDFQRNSFLNINLHHEKNKSRMLLTFWYPGCLTLISARAKSGLLTKGEVVSGSVFFGLQAASAAGFFASSPH